MARWRVLLTEPTSVIEPLRAYDGKCGPPNKNATCAGYGGSVLQFGNVDLQQLDVSMNSVLHDLEHVGILTANPSSEKTVPLALATRAIAWAIRCIAPTSTQGLFSGNTTDGTCGGKNNYVCNELYGLCCNKDGKCGTQASDCGAGW